MDGSTIAVIVGVIVVFLIVLNASRGRGRRNQWEADEHARRREDGGGYADGIVIGALAGSMVAGADGDRDGGADGGGGYDSGGGGFDAGGGGFDGGSSSI